MSRPPPAESSSGSGEARPISCRRRRSSFIIGSSCVPGGGCGSEGVWRRRQRRWLSCHSGAVAASSAAGGASDMADGADDACSCSTGDVSGTGSCQPRLLGSPAAVSRNCSNQQDSKYLASQNTETESELIHSGYQEGVIGMDLDAVKSAISRMSVYEEAFFKEGIEEDRFYMEVLGYRQSTLKASAHEASEVHLSLDQQDGSEILTPSQASSQTMRWRVITWLGYRRRWLASLGHDSAGTATDQTELSFHGGDGGGSVGGDGLRLQLSFQPDGGCTDEAAEAAAGGGNHERASTWLVLKLSRLALKLRKFVDSKRRPSSDDGGPGKST